MRRLAVLLALALAFPASAQGWAKASQGWAKISQGGGGSYATTPPPSGCASGMVPYFSASLQLVCSPTVYAPSTDTTTSTGTIAARNLTAAGLATPGSITVTPTLTQVATITTVAGAALVDGDYFTIKYDGGTIPVEFDLSPGNGTTGGRIPRLFTAGDSADLIRDNIILTLNAAAPTKITASSGGAATVNIVLDTPGADASATPNTENVGAAGFAVTGFANPTAATTYTYRLVARLADGTTTEAGATSTTAAGHATLSATNYNALSWSAVAGASSYDVYRTVAGTTPSTTGKIVSATTALTADDKALPGGGETAPTMDGTGRITSDALAAGRVAIVGTGGRVEDDAGLTYDAATDTLSAGTVSATGPMQAKRIVGKYDAGVGSGASFLATNLGNTATRIVVNQGDTGAIVTIAGGSYGFSAQATDTLAAAPDLGLARASAGVLKVTDGGAGAGKILVADGTEGAPAIAFASAPATGIFAYAYGLGFSRGTQKFLVDANGVSVASNGNYGWSASSSIGIRDTVLTRGGTAATIQLGEANSATHASVAQTLRVQSNITESDQPAPASFKIQGPNGTGTGAVQGIELQTGAVQASGATAHVPTTRVTIKELHINLRLGDVNIYANNAAALAGGLVAGDLYRTGADPDPVMIVH